MVKSSAESNKSLLRSNYFTIIWADFQFIPNGVLFLLFASTERLICSEIYTRLISSWTDIPWVSPNPPFDVNDVISAHWVFYLSCNTSRKMMKLTYFFFTFKFLLTVLRFFHILRRQDVEEKTDYKCHKKLSDFKKDVRMISPVEYWGKKLTRMSGHEYSAPQRPGMSKGKARFKKKKKTKILSSPSQSLFEEPHSENMHSEMQKREKAWNE